MLEFNLVKKFVLVKQNAREKKLGHDGKTLAKFWFFTVSEPPTSTTEVSCSSAGTPLVHLQIVFYLEFQMTIEQLTRSGYQVFRNNRNFEVTLNSCDLE